MPYQNISKVFESTGLVTRKTEGRIRWIDANLDNTDSMEGWFGSLKSIWSLRLDKLESILSEETLRSDLTINISKTMSAPIERVLDAWLNPEMLKQFILPAPGTNTPDVENDPVEGGRFTIVMKVGENEILHARTYVVPDRPNRLVFS
ncbi:MAG: hypothetical protein ACI845_001423 [Gammaproteobacteria bacterium]|jgi:hypothetical protein